MDIILSIDKSEEELIESLLKNTKLASEKISGAGIDGGSDLVTIMLSVTTTTLTSLILLLKNKWKRNKDVVIKVGTMEVRGANPEEISDLLAKMIAADKEKKRKK